MPTNVRGVSDTLSASRKPSLTSDKYFPKACATFEGQLVQNSPFRQKLQQESQDHFLLRNHDVAKAGFRRIALHLWLRQQTLAVIEKSLAISFHLVTPRIPLFAPRVLKKAHCDGEVDAVDFSQISRE